MTDDRNVHRLDSNRTYRVIDRSIAATIFIWQLFWTLKSVFNGSSDVYYLTITILFLALLVCWWMGKQWAIVPLLIVLGVCAIAAIPLVIGLFSSPPGIEHSTQSFVALGCSVLAIPVTIYLFFRIRTLK